MTSSPSIRSRERHDGWTVARRIRFVDSLELGLSASRAAMLCGMTRQTAYRLKARDEGFALAWDMAVARAALSAARARMTRRKRPFAQLARLGRVSLPDADVATVAADFDAHLARLGEGQR